MLDFAYDTALEVGKFEHDTWKDILSKLPSENELRWAYNQSKTENSGPSMFLPKNFNPIKFIYQIYRYFFKLNSTGIPRFPQFRFPQFSIKLNL